MANEYVYEDHTFITIKVPHGVKPLFTDTEALDADEILFGPHVITLFVRDRVWFIADYHFFGLYEELRIVTEKDNNGMGTHGECLFSVPALWCKFYSDEEAESIARCMDADASLLSYARG